MDVFFQEECLIHKVSQIGDGRYSISVEADHLDGVHTLLEQWLWLWNFLFLVFCLFFSGIGARLVYFLGAYLRSHNERTWVNTSWLEPSWQWVQYPKVVLIVVDNCLFDVVMMSLPHLHLLKGQLALLLFANSLQIFKLKVYVIKVGHRVCRNLSDFIIQLINFVVFNFLSLLLLLLLNFSLPTLEVFLCADEV